PQSIPSPRRAAAPASAALAPQPGTPRPPARTPPPHRPPTARRCYGPPPSPALSPTTATVPTAQPAAQTAPVASSLSHQVYARTMVPPTSPPEAASQDVDPGPHRPHRRPPGRPATLPMHRAPFPHAASPGP